jgi:glycosyltransferase involved in cell wall biosynthesis
MLKLKQLIDYSITYWGKEEELTHLLAKTLGNKSLRRRAEVKTIALVFKSFRNGGTKRVLAHLIDIFAATGITVLLLTDEPSHEDDYKPSSDFQRVVLPACTSPEQFEERAKSIASVARKYTIDLFIHHAHRDCVCFWDGLVFKAISIPCILHVHNNFARCLQMGHPNRFLELPAFYQPYNIIVTLSRVDAHYWNAYHDNVFVMPNPVVKSETSITRKTMQERQRQIGHREVMFAGRLAPENNYRDLLDIMTYILNECPDVHLTLCGISQNPNDQDFMRFRQDIRERDLEKHIALVGYQKNLTPYFQNADLLLVLADIGGWSMVISEAMSESVPVVCYDLPWLELLRDGRGVIRAKFRDKRDVADKAIRLLKDNAALVALGLEGKRHAQFFQSLGYGKLWQEVFDSLAEDDVSSKTHAVALKNTNDLQESQISGFWGKRYSSSKDSDPEAIETHRIMIETYNRYLKTCFNAIAVAHCDMQA